MDRINSKTRTVNRLINLSSFMYTVENIRTLPEINSTVHENRRPIGSIITVIMIGVLETEAIVHSSKVVS